MGTAVNFDGRPFMIGEVFGDQSDSFAQGLFGGSGNVTVDDYLTFSLSNPGWNNFQDIPSLGWFNLFDWSRRNRQTNTVAATFASRQARRSRQHGLSEENVEMRCPHASGEALTYGVLLVSEQRIGFTGLFHSKDFVQGLENNYPDFSEVFNHLKPNQSVALSRQFCLVKTQLCTFLFKNDTSIGIFDTERVLLLGKTYGYERESVLEDPIFSNVSVQIIN